MSVVAWDGKTLAADRQFTSGSRRLTGDKIKRIPNGDIVAWTGERDKGLMLTRWYENGADPKLWPNFQEGGEWVGLIIVRKGKAFSLEQYPEFLPVIDPFAAWGEGGSYALGAMAMGADAVKAVEVANRFCNSCGMGIMSFVADL